jgi:hypothetical protein
MTEYKAQSDSSVPLKPLFKEDGDEHELIQNGLFLLTP